LDGGELVVGDGGPDRVGGTGVVEQRYQAVLKILSGAAVTDVARRYGVVRQTVHDWLGSYGLAGLVDKASKPLSCPHQTSAEVEVRIVE
jgi:transposase-like protein